MAAIEASAQDSEELLPKTLHQIHQTDPGKTDEGCVQYVLSREDDWAVCKYGSHDDCMQALMALQPNGVNHALDHDGWYIVPHRIWSQLKGKAQSEASALVAETNKPNPGMYQKFLKTATNIFGSIRVFTYVPTIMTLVASANSSQYSLWTWIAWLMANATMSASIFENNGRKFDNLVLVNIGNTFMCLLTIAFIAYYR